MLEDAHKRFQQLREQQGRVEIKALDEVWEGLETIDVESILGRWKGGDFDTGHPVSELLTKSRWYGKTFNSQLDAKPLICRGDDGELFSDRKSGNGEASLWMIEFRGETTATMVYDGLPIFDHFKRVDEKTLMGIMNGKSFALHEGQHYYFYLERA